MLYNVISMFLIGTIVLGAEIYLNKPVRKFPRIIRRLSQRRRKLVGKLELEEKRLEELYTMPTALLREKVTEQRIVYKYDAIRDQKARISELHTRLEGATKELRSWLNEYREFLDGTSAAKSTPVLIGQYRVNASPTKVRVPDDIEQIEALLEKDELKKLKKN